MRADRLLSILLLLQAQGKMTARELAQELEVSERTIYRDIDALSFAGVPIFSESGHQGGYALVENYQTTLTGLSKGELRALFMLGNLTPLGDLGVREELQRALLKISAALPRDRCRDDEQISRYFHFDSSWWRQDKERFQHLQVIQQAIYQNQKLNIVYQPPFAVEIKRLVAPFGLVAKAGRWYLVCARNNGIHVHRVSHLLDVSISQEHFACPERFNLAAFWQGWCADYESLLTDFTATVRVAPRLIPFLPMYFGHSIHTMIDGAPPPDLDGWIQLDLTFESFDAARDRFLSFGSAVEVLAPRSLKLSIIDYAEQIVHLYKQSPAEEIKSGIV